MEAASLLEIDNAFISQFASKPPSASLVQLAESESSSGSSSDFSESDDEGIQLADEDGDVTMEATSNHVDKGKLSGYSPSDDKIDQMFEEFNGGDNDEFVNEIIQDFCTKGKASDSNPDGVILTKSNGERATRKFIGTALKLNDAQADKWMSTYFDRAWKRYDVNNEGSIQDSMLPTYFRSLLGDFKAQFNLREEDQFQRSLRDPYSTPV